MAKVYRVVLAGLQTSLKHKGFHMNVVPRSTGNTSSGTEN